MKIAFLIPKSSEWTGGANYLRNLILAVQESGTDEVEIILVYMPGSNAGASDELRKIDAVSAVDLQRNRPASMLSRLVRFFWRDIELEALLTREGVDLVFLTGIWLGPFFSFPTIAWIPDFQYRRLPHMFSLSTRLKKWVGQFLLSLVATRLMLSSRDSERDCLKFLPFSKGRTVAIPFSVKMPEIFDRDALRDLRVRYKLPSRFVYLPNQLWQHKNHITVLRALLLLKQRGIDAHVVATGSPSDYRNPAFPRSIFSFVEKNELGENFLFLGLVPYVDIDPLMRASCCVINPSLFEGWSTTVEEAKALGVPLLLSNIAVHVEQAPSDAVFFSPLEAEEIANSIVEALSLDPGSDLRIDREACAINHYRALRTNFGRNFLELCNTVRSQ